MFGWHLRPCAIHRLLPPWRRVKILSYEGSPDVEGSKIVILVYFGLLCIRWELIHSHFIAGKEFSDLQIKGPFRSFCHVHRVTPMGSICAELEDQIEFRFPFSFFNMRLQNEFHRLFSWRHRRLSKDLMSYARYSQKPLRILLSGSSGLIGRQCLAFLRAGGHTVVRLIRSKDQIRDDTIYWDPVHGEIKKEDFEDFDAMIHFAGANIASGRWTQAKKAALTTTRCRDTWLLSQVLCRLYRPPKTLICASAVGFYGNRDEEPLTEESAKGEGFLADLSAKWEQSSAAIQNRGTRVVHTRFGYVLSQEGGMLSKMLPAFRLGLGTILGSGEQMMPWVAIDDVVCAIYHVLMTEEISGPVNVAAPHPVTQRTFAKTLAKALKRPLFLRLPAKALQILLKEMADELLLTSENVMPKRLLETGYLFRYEELEALFADLL